MGERIYKAVKYFYSFGPYRLYAAERELFRGSEAVNLTPKALEALMLLIAHHGHVVDKDQLMNALWPDTQVEEANLGFQISQLRKVLGDNPGGQAYIETIPRRGYRFSAAVAESWQGADAPPASPAAASHPRGRRWVPWALVAATALAAPAVWWKTGQPHTQAPLLLTELTTDTGLTYQPTLSPDGKLLAYASDRSGEGNLDIWVQMLPRGNPIRLTNDKADDSEPSFSLDGTRIVFVSGRDGGGIYSIPTLGGEARRIAGPGHGPRFSPDGVSVVYWEGRADSVGPIFVAPAVGGQRRQIPEHWRLTRSPLWTPDGKHVLFLGARDYGSPRDWWVASLDGAPPVRTGAVESFRTHELGPLFENAATGISPGAWIPGTNEVVFSAKSGDSTNLWKIGVSPETWRASGEPQRLTFGSGLECYPSAALGGRLLFSSVIRNLDIWSLPANANAAKVTGNIRQLTEGAASDSSSSVSDNGARMVFESNRTGQLVVWTKDLKTGKERQISTVPSAENLPRISHDGSRVAYSIVNYPSRSFETYVVPFEGGSPEKVCDGCASASDWSRDGQTILFQSINAPRPHLGLANVAGGKTTLLVQDAKNAIWDGYFSPDGRWVSFGMVIESESTLARFIVPFREGKLRREDEWIPAKYLKWSPDGNRVYGLSAADGWQCIWTQRLDAASKRIVGEPQPLYHFHNAMRSLANVGDPSHIGLSIAQNQIVFTLADLTGNIWMVEPESRH